jgi:quercetin dioxygenase-like cupin family protein
MSGEAESAGQVRSWDTHTMPWEIRHIDELDGDLAAKPLIEDPDTGMSVMKMKYFAGFTNEWHTHNCAHGMYVLDGILKTHAGSFGPGSFVWFPEGSEMEHGATQDNDVTFLFGRQSKDRHAACEDLGTGRMSRATDSGSKLSHELRPYAAVL